MSLWDTLTDPFKTESPKFKISFLTPDQVDVAYDAEPITEGAAYIRLWLVGMRLASGSNWFQTRYPVVHTAIRYTYNGQIVTIPYVAGVDYFKGVAESNLDRVLSRNQPVTPLFPYMQGLVSLQAGLFSMKANDLIGSFISTMGRFAKLLPVPELSSVLTIVEPLYSSIEELFNAGDSRLELGYQSTFSGAGGGGGNDLKAGYFAVILKSTDPKRQFREEDLRISQDSLRLKGKGSELEELEGHNYVLFRIEKRNHQDWEALRSINELVQRAQDAILGHKQEAARDLLPAIKVAIARSPDIVRGDREAMYTRIKAELEELGLQGQISPAGSPRALHNIMKRSGASMSDEDRNALTEMETLFENS